MEFKTSKKIQKKNLIKINKILNYRGTGFFMQTHDVIKHPFNNDEKL